MQFSHRLSMLKYQFIILLKDQIILKNYDDKIYWWCVDCYVNIKTINLN
jgi:hypothetical protein